MFSPTPRQTPRKSVYRGRLETASVSRGTPSVVSDREPLTPARSSRVNALKRAASPTSTAGDTVRTARYDNGDERIYWAKDERCAVYAMGALPREVQQLVKNSDLVTSPLGGHVDPSSGYAYMTTPSMLIAWNYSKRTQSSPTVYAFPAPSSRAPMRSLPPVIAALHSTGSGEPGVILVSTTGEIRYWDSMSLALSNVDRYQGLQLDLGGEDYADKIWPVDQNTFIITTFSSLAFRLSIASHSGRQTPSVTPLMRPGGMFGRASSSIFSLREDREGIAAVAVEGSNVWVLARRTVQKWQIGADGLKYVLDVDLHDLIGNELFPENWSNGAVELELSDLSAVYPNQLAALASYTEQTGSSASRSTGVSYAIVVLGSGGRGGGLFIKRVIQISYSAPLDARTLDVPRLIIPFDSSTAYVRFASTVLMASLDSEGGHEEVITLKDPLRNAFIGSGHLTSPILRSPSAPFILMPAFGGLMAVEAFTAPVSINIPSSSATATARLKSKMEQAVFFGDRSDNPLSFDVMLNAAGDVAVAAEAISTEILSCTSPYMPAIYELRPQLADRLNRLKELIVYIRRNGLLSRLPQASRRVLSRDGEKAKAAVDLWDYQNRLMDQMHTQSPKSLLSDSIIAFMDQFGAEEDDDRIRQFFRTQAQHLDRLLELVFATFRNAIADASRDRAEGKSAWILQANRVFIIVVRAAAQYQEDELPTYETDRVSPTVEQWTAQTPILDALETLYSMTEQLIADRTRDLGSAIDTAPTPSDTPDMKAQRQMQYLLKNQMAEIAAAVCANMEDKLRATSRRHITEGGEEQEGIILKRKWEELRPRVIRPLVLIDRVSHAYELAEHHNDYETLVWLCHDQVAGAGAVKLQEYIERFGEEFAFVLYQWYIDQGQQHALLSQDEVYGGLVTKFFEMRDHPELAWLHHLACKRYGAAATCLAKVDSGGSMLDAKHIMSSIGKLTAVAEMRANGNSEQRRKRLIEFDDELDIIQVQENLRSALIATASARRTTSSAVDDYLPRHITLLGSRPAFYDLVVESARKLADGDALDIEGLVDVLTLKDNWADGEGDPAIALDRLAKDTSLPEGRKQVALLSVWRRVYIRDDWASISNTAGKSEEKIQQLLRQTLAYTTIRAVGNLTGIPQSFVLSPYTSSQPPLLAELTARFPDRLPDEIEALMADHQDEIRLLERYMDEAGLEARMKEVAELVKRDAEGLGEDLDM